MTSESERRREPRIPLTVKMRFRLLFSPDGSPPEAELHNGNNLVFNISRGGFFLSTKNFLEIGSEIQADFPLEPVRAVIQGRAVVVRANNYNYPTHGRYEYGLQFKELVGNCVDSIDRFVKLVK